MRKKKNISTFSQVSSPTLFLMNFHTFLEWIFTLFSSSSSYYNNYVRERFEKVMAGWLSVQSLSDKEKVGCHQPSPVFVCTFQEGRQKSFQSFFHLHHPVSCFQVHLWRLFTTWKLNRISLWKKNLSHRWLHDWDTFHTRLGDITSIDSVSIPVSRFLFSPSFPSILCLSCLTFF